MIDKPQGKMPFEIGSKVTRDMLLIAETTFMLMSGESKRDLAAALILSCTKKVMGNRMESHIVTYEDHRLILANVLKKCLEVVE